MEIWDRKMQLHLQLSNKWKYKKDTKHFTKKFKKGMINYIMKKKRIRK